MSDLVEARAWLDSHINREATAGSYEGLSLDRMRALTDLLGEPQQAYPVIHVTGTNGKGSAATMIASLVRAHGLSVGRFSSPHLERLNERLEWDGTPIDDDELTDLLVRLRAVVDLLEGPPPSWFELVTAAAFLWFADLGVDVAVVEVGLLGRFDATNVADGTVAVVTNVGRDHTDRREGWRSAIAVEKAGIVKPGSTLVLGDTDPDVQAAFIAEQPDEIWRRDEEFGCESNLLAVGGRLVGLRTPFGSAEEVFLPLNGEHQGDNAAVALAAVEAFFGRQTAEEIVEEGFGTVRLPGRFEVVGREPLVVLDAAHNPDGLETFVHTMGEFGTAGDLVVVYGQLQGRDPDEMFDILSDAKPARVIVCTAPSERAVPAEELATAAEAAGLTVDVIEDIEEAVTTAQSVVFNDGALAMTGSLTVVGKARTHFAS